MDIINQKPLQEIKEDKKQEIEKATVELWEAIAAIGADLAEAQSTIANLQNAIATLKGGV
jgi:hypothetical protein